MSGVVCVVCPFADVEKLKKHSCRSSDISMRSCPPQYPRSSIPLSPFPSLYICSPPTQIQILVCDWSTNHVTYVLSALAVLPAVSPLQCIKYLGLWTMSYKMKECEQICNKNILGLPRKTSFRKDLQDHSKHRNYISWVAGIENLDRFIR